MNYANFTDDDLDDFDEMDSIIDEFVQESLPQEQLHTIISEEEGKFEPSAPLEGKERHETAKGAESIPKLKVLPSHLEYAFLDNNPEFPVIISSSLSKDEKILLLRELSIHKGAFAWKVSDIQGISPSFCSHKILMEDNFKPVVQPQRRLNPKVQDVVKDEIIKLLDAGLIYPISDSAWVSPIHVVPKKGGMTVVTNDKDELIPTRTVTG